MRTLVLVLLIVVAAFAQPSQPFEYGKDIQAGDITINAAPWLGNTNLGSNPMFAGLPAPGIHVMVKTTDDDTEMFMVVAKVRMYTQDGIAHWVENYGLTYRSSWGWTLGYVSFGKPISAEDVSHIKVYKIKRPALFLGQHP